MNITAIHPLNNKEIIIPDEHPYWDVTGYDPRTPLPYNPISLAHVFRHLNPTKLSLAPGETWQTDLATDATRALAGIGHQGKISLSDLRGRVVNFKVKLYWRKFKTRAFRRRPRPGHESFYLYADVSGGPPNQVFRVFVQNNKASMGRKMVYNPAPVEHQTLRLDAQGNSHVNPQGSRYVGRVDLFSLHTASHGYCYISFVIGMDNYLYRTVSFPLLTTTTQTGETAWIA